MTNLFSTRLHAFARALRLSGTWLRPWLQRLKQGALSLLIHRNCFYKRVVDAVASSHLLLVAGKRRPQFQLV
jgi:hypothetical protein